MKTQGLRGIVRSQVDVKLWTGGGPSCDEARPAVCPVCDAASRPTGAPLVLHGHGRRERQLRGPPTPGEAATTQLIYVRRYECQRCGALMTVGPHNRSLYSRLARRLSVGPLTPDDTAEYVRLRLTKAGCDRELFATDALAMLHEGASGALRDIDRIATAALRDAARKKRKLVERDTVARVLDAEASSEAES